MVLFEMNNSESATSSSPDDNLGKTIKAKEQRRIKIWDEFFAQCREREHSCHTEDLIPISPVEPRIPYSMPSDLVQKWVDSHNIGTDHSATISLEPANKKSTVNGCLEKPSSMIEQVERLTLINETANQDGISSGNETQSTNLFTSKGSRNNKSSQLSQSRRKGAKKLYTVTDSPVELSSNSSTVIKNHSVLSHNARQTLSLIEKIRDARLKDKSSRSNSSPSIERAKEVENKTSQGSPDFHHTSKRFNKDLPCVVIDCISESNSQCSTIQIVKCTDPTEDFDFSEFSEKIPTTSKSSMSTASNLNLTPSDDSTFKKVLCSEPEAHPDEDFLNQYTPKRSQYKSLSNGTLSTKIPKRPETTCAETTEIITKKSPMLRKSTGFKSHDYKSESNSDDDIPTLISPKKSHPEILENVFDSSKNPNGAKTNCSPRKRMQMANGNEKPQPKKRPEKKASVDIKVSAAPETFMSTNGADGSTKSSTVSRSESLNDKESKRLQKPRRSNRIATSLAATPPKATSPSNSTELSEPLSDSKQKLHEEETENSKKRRYKKIKKGTSESNEQTSEKNLVRNQHSFTIVKKENKERKYCTFSSSDSETDDFRPRHKIIKKQPVDVEQSKKLDLQLFSESEDEATGWDLISFLQKNKTIRKSMIPWSITISKQEI